ncbi:transposase [Streptomyces mirabilis]|uniref:transposase n=1 Tax=Streptomyces mirabilis TaxID=68239 RepID=UPI00379F0FBE
MSVQPRPWPEPDLQVASVIRAIYRGRREVPLPVQVRDRLGELFPDAVFAEAFGKAGKPGWSPGRLALVTVLQKAANLTDRQAADEVRENLAWKYALGLGLEDPGFDHSVLSEFRSRVVAHHLEERVLDLLLERLQAIDLLTSGGIQRTDSTHVVSAVRDLNRLELAGESVRAALNALCRLPGLGGPGAGGGRLEPSIWRSGGQLAAAHLQDPAGRPRARLRHRRLHTAAGRLRARLADVAA